MAIESMDTRDEEAPLVVDVSGGETPKNRTRDVHILSCAFLLIFLAYGAAQNLETTINSEGNLGTVSLGILYVSFAFFSLFASLVVRVLGSKNAVVLGTTGYWLYIAANLKPTWYTMVPVSLYMGFAASIIWVGEGTYLTSIARSHAIDTGLHEGTVIGNFNGEFWAVFALHQFVGNLITLAVLPKGTVCVAFMKNSFFPLLFYLCSWTMVSSSISGWKNQSSFLHASRYEGSTGSTTLLFIVFLCSMTLGTILMCFIRKTNDKEKVSEDSSVSFCSAVASRLSSVILPLLDMRMLLVIPLIAYSGLQQAFVWASYTKDIVNPTLGEAGVGGAMAVYGAFDAICSLAAGRLTSGLRSITIIVCGGAFFQALIFLWLLLKYSATSGVLGVIYPLLMAAFLGIGDGVLNTQLSALLALLFKHDTEGAFAQLKVWQSSAIAVVFFLSPVVTLQTMVEIMIGAISVSLVSFLFLTLKVEKAFSSHQVTNM
ncbi:UNC93-like protein 3 [Gossypium australe]|uniref:UNC93-like protein 3 n=1 Tax=Gossypium australe TaxID=47621 RepID=A0A5B6UB07_9ROSI|nr:UNC93-like protein 3 [Gossypium australe]